MTHFQAEETHF